MPTGHRGAPARGGDRHRRPMIRETPRPAAPPSPCWNRPDHRRGRPRPGLPRLHHRSRHHGSVLITWTDPEGRDVPAVPAVDASNRRHDWPAVTQDRRDLRNPRGYHRRDRDFATTTPRTATPPVDERTGGATPQVSATNPAARDERGRFTDPLPVDTTTERPLTGVLRPLPHALPAELGS